jgi:GNAT superfamily N-acetyltransferase
VNIVIREGDVHADGERISRALKEHLTPLADQARFEWLYQRNPHGQVRVWLALDGNEEIIGTAAAFPRALHIAGRQAEGWVFGDFCVSDSHRSLGPAIALQRALLDGAGSSGVPICYDFPSTAMTAVYKRLKIEPAARMIRMAKLLRVDRKVGERVGNEVIAAALSSLGNFVLRAAAGRAAADQGIEISLLEERCGSEFDILAANGATRRGVCVQRSAHYLNWRYLDNPYKDHRLLVARRDDVLGGFAVLSSRERDGEIVDIFGEDETVVGRLIDEAAELFRRHGAITVSAELIETHPWTELLKKRGFYPRESKPFIVYAPASSDPLPPQQDAWFITAGDRDS